MYALLAVLKNNLVKMIEHSQDYNESQTAIMFIAGAGRSGSTLVGNALEQAFQGFHVGEMWGVFDYTAEKGLHCSCGKSYPECEFWREIFETSFGPEWADKFRGWDFQENLPRSKQLPFILLRRKFRRSDGAKAEFPKLEEPFEAIKTMFGRIQQTTRVNIILDSSKFSSYAWMLTQKSKYKVIVLHLVRDPRSTTNSWITKPIPMYDTRNRMFTTRTRTELEAVVYWIRSNMAAWLLSQLGIPYKRIQYEAYVNNPYDLTKQIADFMRKTFVPVTLDRNGLDNLKKGQIVHKERHLIGSNPGLKRQVGDVTIREDLKWLDDVSKIRYVVWTLIFLPWLVWFGYPLWIKKLHY